MAAERLIAPNQDEIEFQIGYDGRFHTLLCTVCLEAWAAPAFFSLFVTMEEHRAKHFGQLLNRV